MNNSDTYIQRRTRRPRHHKAGKMGLISFLAALLFFGLVSYGQWIKNRHTKTSPSPDVDVECLKIVSLPDDVPQIIKEYTGFTVSFNPAHHLPNYVAWELTGTETEGQTPRNSKFRVDDDVYGCATPGDYRGSGFDRGHMAPAADMKWSQKAMDDCHFLTNICPQDHNINSGRWSTLEKLSRQWAKRDSAIIIICGPILTDELPRAIGDQQVSVPERFFKVILAPFATPPSAIAFVMPNFKTDDSMEAMAVSVDDIEQITGFDFFNCLPDELENTIEQNSNFRYWNKRKRSK